MKGTYKRLSVVAILAGLLVVGAAYFVWAQPGYSQRFGYGMGPGWGVQGLNLSEEQRAKLNEIWSDFAKRRFDLASKLRQSNWELRSLLLDPARNDSEIKAKVKEINGLREQILDLSVEQHKRVAEVLAPEQLKALSQYGWVPGYGEGWRCGPASGWGHMERGFSRPW
ncbi:MAG: Spy/CpxP family protein refolding chaperone [bacterium]